LDEVAAKPVGHIHQRVKLSAEKAVTVRMLVDTGATFSVIPKGLAQTIDVKRLRRPVTIELADGRRVKFDAATAIIRIGDREAPATVLIGDVAEPILGVETLEALGLAVDTRRRRLTPSRHYAVRLGGFGGGRSKPPVLSGTRRGAEAPARG